MLVCCLWLLSQNFHEILAPKRTGSVCEVCVLIKCPPASSMVEAPNLQKISILSYFYMPTKFSEEWIHGIQVTVPPKSSIVSNGEEYNKKAWALEAQKNRNKVPENLCSRNWRWRAFVRAEPVSHMQCPVVPSAIGIASLKRLIAKHTVRNPGNGGFYTVCAKKWEGSTKEYCGVILKTDKKFGEYFDADTVCLEIYCCTNCWQTV